MRGQQQKLLIDTAFIGVAGALGAQAFLLLLKACSSLLLGDLGGYRMPALSSENGIPHPAVGPHGLWLVPLATTLGGLLTGLLVYGLAPEAEGHGTDAAVNAFHNLGGVIRARVPLVKLVASAITIGSGGSAGREGPVALVSAGMASLYARLFHRTPPETRLLLLVGMASGLSAIFRSPIGTAIFAVEVLYSEGEFETGALVFTLFGSIVAYALNGLFSGFQPLFEVPTTFTAPGVGTYGWYVLLGIACGTVAAVLPTSLYSMRDLFHRVPCPPHLKPAIGGLAVGVVGLVLPQLLGGGYSWIQSAITGSLPLYLMIFLALGKILTFALTIGSGGSGGVFAPSLFTGAMLGAALSHLFHQPQAAFAVVGMAAVFGGAARVPIATILMAMQMTGGYQFLVPAGLAVVFSSIVESLLTAPLRYKSLYERQVPTRADSPAHYVDEVRSALDLLRTHNITGLPEASSLELLSLLESGVPLGLGDGKRLRIGILRPESPCAGNPIESGCLTGKEGESEVVLIRRGGRTWWPGAGFQLQGGDQVVVIASEAGWQDLSGHLGPMDSAAPRTG